MHTTSHIRFPRAISSPVFAILRGAVVLFWIWRLILVFARAADPVPLIPIETLFRNPELSRMELSPNGDYVAYLAPYEHRQNIFVKRIGEETATRITSATERDLGNVVWVGNDRLVYAVDEGGNENWRIYAVDRDGGNPKLLTPERGVAARIVGKVPGDEDRLLVSSNQRDRRAMDLYKVDVKTGAAELVVQNDQRFAKYVTDNAGTVRLAIATDGVNFALFHRLTDTAPFERILTTDFHELVSPLFFTPDNRSFYALSNRSRDKAAVVRVDPKDATDLEVIFQHPEYDASGLTREGSDRHLATATYVGETVERVFFDENVRNRYRDVQSQLPGLVIDFVSSAHGGNEFLIKAWSDRDPGTMYLYRAATKQLTRIGSVAPWIDSSQLAAVRPIAYRSRDGLTIHGYLTLPKGATGPLPTLLVIHGGPWARDQWRADPEVQFLANRGYAVLQINYRGSTGYGRAFTDAGFKQWGRAMQNDITDGAHWLIEQKIADPKRLGIYGISYGGYAALAGLAFTPELYRCGIDDCGVSDIGDWLNRIPPQAPARAMLFTMVGDPEKDREALAEVSPLQHANRIKVPVLMAHGGNDPRVPQSHSDRMAAALKAAGVDVEYLTKGNEGHSFHLEENKIEFYHRMERFLARHLGGRQLTDAVASYR